MARSGDIYSLYGGNTPNGLQTPNDTTNLNGNTQQMFIKQEIKQEPGTNCMVSAYLLLLPLLLCIKYKCYYARLTDWSYISLNNFQYLLLAIVIAFFSDSQYFFHNIWICKNATFLISIIYLHFALQ